MPATCPSAADTAPRYRQPEARLERDGRLGLDTAEGLNVTAWAHPTIPEVIIRAGMAATISVGFDLTAADARRLAAFLLAAADELDQR